MILILIPSPPFLICTQIEGSNIERRKILLNDNWKNTIFNSKTQNAELEAIIYVLSHGGNQVIEPVSLMTPALLKKMGKTIGFFPEHNDIVLKAAKELFSFFPGIPQFLACETAYFTDLPLETSTYAVPYKLYLNGIKRYGSDGIAHQWAAEKMTNYSRIVSVHICEQTNIAAIKNGKPVESTIGFSSIEGIPSMHGCGDIDPTIIFQLSAYGMSLKEINKILTQKSGFSGYKGKNFSFYDMLNINEYRDINEIYFHSIIRYMGAFISIMNGADAFVFICEDIKESIPFIREICNQYEFLDIRCKININDEEHVCELSSKDSRIKVCCLKYNKALVLSDKIKDYLKEK